MDQSIQQQNFYRSDSAREAEEFDFAYVSTTARIALYDDLRSAPRITEIKPAETTSYIESLASTIYDQSQRAGGSIPYTVIREVSENFIHARFKEIIVSILDKGNTIRFADQGPGIMQKDKAQLPGFSSAIEPMKHYIRGVGSGLPIVKEYLAFSHGSITIEDNLGAGSVITVSLVDKQETPDPRSRISQRNDYSDFESTRIQMALAPLSPRERSFLPILLLEGPLGVTEMSQISDVPTSSTHVVLKKLEEAGLVEKTAAQKRVLTPLGREVAKSLVS